MGVAPCKIRRSNSSSQINEDYKFRDVQDPAEIEKEQHEKNMRYVRQVFILTVTLLCKAGDIGYTITWNHG